MGDMETLQNLLAIFAVNQMTDETPTAETNDDIGKQFKVKPSIDISVTCENDLLQDTPTPTQDRFMTDRTLANQNVPYVDTPTPTEDSHVLFLRNSNEISQCQNVTESIPCENNKIMNDSVQEEITKIEFNVDKAEKTSLELSENSRVNGTALRTSGESKVPSLESSQQSFGEETKTMGKSVPQEVTSPVVTVDILNEPIGDNEKTLLHVACKEGHRKVVRVLLENGADPAVK